MKKVLLTLLLTSTLLGLPYLGNGADTAAKVSAKEPVAKVKRPKQSPFRGTIRSVDAKALTVTLVGKTKDRIVQLTPSTKIAREGKIIELKEILAGEYVGGLMRANAEGEMKVVTLNVGIKPKSRSKSKTKETKS